MKQKGMKEEGKEQLKMLCLLKMRYLTLKQVLREVKVLTIWIKRAQVRTDNYEEASLDKTGDVKRMKGN